MARATISDLARAERVLCHGVTGSGKSTAAERIGRALGLPVHLVDEEIGWLPGWVERPAEEQRAIAARIVQEPRWVLDSAYASYRDLVLERADVVVALDYPRWLSLGRLLRRTAIRLVTRERACNGNTESWRSAVSRDSIVRWHFRTFSGKRERARSWEAAAAGPKVLLLSRPRELDVVVAEVEAQRPLR